MFFRKKETEIVSPVKGKLIRLQDVPDPTFSEEMVGKGVAVIPEENEIYAPADGKITSVFPTGHAIGLTTREGIDLLIHIGLDTVELKGEGFEAKVKEGASVKLGDLLLLADLEKIRQAGCRLESPVIICNPDQCKKIVYAEPAAVDRGDLIMKFFR